jgi:quercetin dioxygenase-like cupin family protein
MAIPANPSRFRAAQAGQIREGTRDHFIGRAIINPLGPVLGTEQITVHAVTFCDGARTRPHKHVGDLLLYFADGQGMVAVDGGEDVVVEPGTFVMLPAEVVHMHGGVAGADVLQLAIEADHGITFDVDCPDAWRDYVWVGEPP